MSSGVVMGALLVANAVHLVAIPAFGALSDRVGRRPVYLAGAIGTAVWALLFFRFLDTRQPVLITVAVVGGLVMHAAMYGPQAAFFAEQFDITVRYSATSIGYQVTSIFAGSLAPIIAVALLKSYGTATPIAIYIIAAAVSALGVLAAKETRPRNLADVPSKVAAARKSAPTPSAQPETARCCGETEVPRAGSSACQVTER